jgi:hypothetical protein
LPAAFMKPRIWAIFAVTAPLIGKYDSLTDFLALVRESEDKKLS